MPREEIARGYRPALSAVHRLCAFVKVQIPRGGKHDEKKNCQGVARDRERYTLPLDDFSVVLDSRRKFAREVTNAKADRLWRDGWQTAGSLSSKSATRADASGCRLKHGK